MWSSVARAYCRLAWELSSLQFWLDVVVLASALVCCSSWQKWRTGNLQRIRVVMDQENSRTGVVRVAGSIPRKTHCKNRICYVQDCVFFFRFFLVVTIFNYLQEKNSPNKRNSIESEKGDIP